VSRDFSISVVIVNWNSRDDLAECLESLEKQTDQEFGTVVVDNGSVDGSIELVRERFPGVTLIENHENVGFAEACNRGIEQAQGAWIALLNNDATAAPNWIEEQRKAARAGGDRLGMLQSRLVFKQRPDRTNSTGVVLFKDGTARDRDFDADFRPDDDVEEVFCTTAGAGLYRRAMLEEVRLPSGILDRNYFMYFEDLDLGWRARLAGWSAQLVPESVVLHKYQGSAVRHGHRWMIVLSHRNRLRTLIKNASARFIARTLPRTLEEIFRLVRVDGMRTVLPLARAVVESSRQRAFVTALARGSREHLEANWVGREGKSLNGAGKRASLPAALATLEKSEQ